MRSTLDYIKKNKLLLLVLLPAFIVHMIITIPSGSTYCFQGKCGVFFWGAHAHDAIWHFAIINSSFNKFPFTAPTYSGSLLTGYNYLLDLLMFSVSKIGISPLISYFKIFPMIWFIVMTGVTIILAKKLQKSALFVGIFLFFVYFSGSFSYILTLYHHQTIWGSSGLLSMQSGLALTNLQFAFSLVVLFYILYMIKIESKNIILLSVLTGINIALKFYAGALSGFIVGAYIVGLFIKEKKVREFFVSLITLLLISTIALIAFYNPSQSLKSGSTFSFAPFATVHSIIEEPEQIYMKDWVNARYYLQNLHTFSPKLIRIEVISLLLFLIFNFGTRIIGLYIVIKKIIQKKISAFDIYLLSTIAVAIFMATFFVQKGIWWNTIQFLYYALFLANIYAAEALFIFITKFKKLGILFATIIILLTIPSSLDIVKGFTSFPSPAYLPQGEKEALDFLKKQPNGIVLADIYDKNNFKNMKAPFPLAAYDDTSYISAFSGKQSYAADIVQLQLLGIPFEKRYQEIQNGNCNILNSVDYIYIRRYENNSSLNKCLSVSSKTKKIFSNNVVIVYSTIK